MADEVALEKVFLGVLRFLTVSKGRIDRRELAGDGGTLSHTHP